MLTLSQVLILLSAFEGCIELHRCFLSLIVTSKMTHEISRDIEIYQHFIFKTVYWTLTFWCKIKIRLSFFPKEQFSMDQETSSGNIMERCHSWSIFSDDLFREQLFPTFVFHNCTFIDGISYTLAYPSAQNIHKGTLLFCRTEKSGTWMDAIYFKARLVCIDLILLNDYCIIKATVRSPEHASDACLLAQKLLMLL